MPYYESVFIARQDVSATQVEGLVENFEAIIKDGGGEVAKKEFWGLRNLAYRIKKNRKGHYVLMNLDSPSPAVLEMERQMRLNEDVLRYMTIRVDELEEGPSAILRSRDRDDRPRRGRDGDRDRGGRDSRPPRDDAPAPAAAEKTPAEAPAEAESDKGDES